MEEKIIESFTLDHDKVLAPYVRVIETQYSKHGDPLTNYDVRLVAPNVQEIPTAAMHTLEHLLAKYLREKLDGYIDCSPYGCRTGFHLLCWGEADPHQAASALKYALQQVLKTTWEEVPGIKRQECGNYKDHSLTGAKAWAAEILDKGISEDAFERILV
ncbi:S-ribosylhomocysteine lyase [Ileibacterium valens]|uniref:S-ribosylhomocysteine lyase n=1 Tax=Ileibacterium valens TaxID=1862668 RepID=A0A1U7NFI2_9FIRM|nr:S-ribosylhomocysteine lyase [Ileibacterium valens]OLU39080.1 S-ribosylhomocysteine lyase [Ileibacterium valens]OLU41729.1 S-ribosylhomocysteine lyase [Erysipelotrichaceae bacterium NYU-BL-F16]OLU41817.1 S-ribosylhomocysteine lyase [Erysipelotrichaceae bacterium NYU-BL-E8]